MNDATIKQGYAYAKEVYGALGVDVDAAVQKANAVPVSMHCWQGDDVVGFDGVGALTGGIATTGNYPGRARTPDELRADIDYALKLIPGRIKLNLHACYAEKNGKRIDRDAYTMEQFAGWADFAAAHGLGVDFNPTFFSHPMMDGDLSLSSPKEANRRFWIEHGKRCREIGEGFAKRLGQPCVINYWMPDGSKDVCVNTVAPRERMTASLNEIFAKPVDAALTPCALESKLFGVGLESYTVASHEFALGYAIKNELLYCLDTGHFHPTETVSAKITAVIQYVPSILLHVSRGVRWDSDHVVALDDELVRINDEIVWNDLMGRVFVGMDYFDASINRIACWAIGMRNERKALLNAYLAPYTTIRAAEATGDDTSRFAMLETRKTLPLGAVWDYACRQSGIPTDDEWLPLVKTYESTILRARA